MEKGFPDSPRESNDVDPNLERRPLDPDVGLGHITNVIHNRLRKACFELLRAEINATVQ